jgi:hypothetical protein
MKMTSKHEKIDIKLSLFDIKVIFKGQPGIKKPDMTNSTINRILRQYSVCNEMIREKEPIIFFTLQHTSESRTVRHSNGHLSDVFCVRLSNAKNRF